MHQKTYLLSCLIIHCVLSYFLAVAMDFLPLYIIYAIFIIPAIWFIWRQSDVSLWLIVACFIAAIDFFLSIALIFSSLWGMPTHHGIIINIGAGLALFLRPILDILIIFATIGLAFKQPKQE